MAVSDPAHLEHWGTFVTTEGGKVRGGTTVINQPQQPRTIAVDMTIVGPGGAGVAAAYTQPQTVAPGKTAAFRAETAVPTPRLWGLDRPSLYRAPVRADVDEETIAFGIRDFKFDTDTGF